MGVIIERGVNIKKKNNRRKHFMFSEYVDAIHLKLCRHKKTHTINQIELNRNILHCFIENTFVIEAKEQ